MTEYLFFPISGNTVETSSHPNEKMHLESAGENGDDSNNMSSLTESDTIN